MIGANLTVDPSRSRSMSRLSGVLAYLQRADGPIFGRNLDLPPKHHGEGGALWAARDENVAAHCGRELLHDREPEPTPDASVAACLVVEVEPLERVRHVLGRDPRACIGDDE